MTDITVRCVRIVVRPECQEKMWRLWKRSEGQQRESADTAAVSTPGRAPLAAQIDETWQRLSRLALWCRAGRLADAELELHGWQRESGCPTTAAIMLAALMARRGDLDAALGVLHRAGRRQNDDPAVGQLLISVLTQADLMDAARRAAVKLHDRHGHEPQIAAWLQLMQVPGYQQLPGVSDAAVEHLATELIDHPQVIASLVAAAEHWQGSDDVQMLRRAVMLAQRDITEPQQQLMIYRALTRLAELADDPDDARRWAHRGLKIDPYCARLAIALSRIEDDEAVGPPATAVLARAVDEHPDYPDLQAALIRREAADGQGESARLRLRRWIERSGSHPLAAQVRRELAA